MKIWVDADACPKAIREIIIRAATRTERHTTFVANHVVPLPKLPILSFVQVSSGFDVADNEIVQRAEAGDLVITQDIPLAAEVIEQGCLAMNPRGEQLTRQNIGARLNIRDFMDTMRASGVQTGGPSALGSKEKMAFANTLDRLLAKTARRR